jgi:hypothetical protein
MMFGRRGRQTISPGVLTGTSMSLSSKIFTSKSRPGLPELPGGPGGSPAPRPLIVAASVMPYPVAPETFTPNRSRQSLTTGGGNGEAWTRRSLP